MKVQIVRADENSWYSKLDLPYKIWVVDFNSLFYKIAPNQLNFGAYVLKSDCMNDEEYDVIGDNLKNVEEFKSGAKRENKAHKSRPDLISPYFSERLGFVLAKGASAHGERNWEKGIPNESFLASLERHLLAYKQSILEGYTSNNTEEDHLGNLAFNLMGLIHNEEIRKLK